LSFGVTQHVEHCAVYYSGVHLVDGSTDIHCCDAALSFMWTWVTAVTVHSGVRYRISYVVASVLKIDNSDVHFNIPHES